MTNSRNVILYIAMSLDGDIKFYAGSLPDLVSNLKNAAGTETQVAKRYVFREGSCIIALRSGDFVARMRITT